ncbi:hypothetical protein LNKW23_35560 [Paralimibaculum aggregatum]|uniref:Monovalent cation/H(+) antiporter subunit G n=1 Tax=Paralimibaculum aggregatum TaxID=3036245 RepID=A0ABQ6LPB6_9RHOB|nr:monovalent cation/H(+) antiporter subunit G [Limibaculum sp. NKW23]GMG84341.1 hypothetical protein LNKW23_35560 [Limibaculum sp. NKW23]
MEFLGDAAGLVRDLVSGVLLIAGAGFYLIGAIGLNRMPDVFTRMHATSVSDTLGLGLMFVGMLVQAGPTLIGFKLVVIFALLFLTAPIATHALARAALHDGEEPLLADEEGRLVPTDLAASFPDLEQRIESPLTSESVTAPEGGEGDGNDDDTAQQGEDRPSNS